MIWLIGNKGMLGTELASALAAAGLPAVGTDREVDILDPAALEAFAAGKDIRWLVNCAAYTAVDKAEDVRCETRSSARGSGGSAPVMYSPYEECYRLNAEGPANLAALAHSLGSRLLHLSTDYVFSGSATEPYAEDTPVSPAGAYGRTKAEGERRVMAAAPESVILRTAWLYGRHGPNFVYTMLRLMKERSTMGVVADQHGTPTSAADLSAAIVHLVTLPQLPAGIYHYTNAGATTWYHFAREIHRLGRQNGFLERDCIINPLTTAEYPTKAARPAYSVLSKDRIQALGVRVPGWEESLAGFLEDFSCYRDA
ncbi:MAG: dTDP-4-dehydrorhamnose reductase [Spirochaetota bacterium]